MPKLQMIHPIRGRVQRVHQCRYPPRDRTDARAAILYFEARIAESMNADVVRYYRLAIRELEPIAEWEGEGE